jgi:membrane protein YqaA with SNARE-associated domain
MTEPTLQYDTEPKTRTRNPLRKLYNWVLGWAESRYGPWALFAIAFAESSFFPIPPDALLMPMCLGRRKKALRFALICTVGSVLGGILGYYIGWVLYRPVAQPFIDWIGLGDQFDTVLNLYGKYAVLAVGAAALTPLPYKLFAIGAGFSYCQDPGCGIKLYLFVIVSIAFRGLRFFAEAVFLWRFGGGIRDFIDRYFWLATTIFFALLVGGFYALKHMAALLAK